jgi:hypothetical protein
MVAALHFPAIFAAMINQEQVTSLDDRLDALRRHL